MPLLILSASAGSGKTFRISREFVRLSLLSSDSSAVTRILAMTFTNKATVEMKDRVLKLLSSLSSGSFFPSPGDPLYEVLVGIGERETAARARKVLEHVLKEYHYFSISTIDAFFQKIIRQFQRELHITYSYEVELNMQMVLEAAVDRLFCSLDHDDEAYRWVSGWIDRELEAGGDWNVKKKLVHLGQQLFAEGIIESWTGESTIQELGVKISEIDHALKKIEEMDESIKKELQQLLHTCKVLPEDFIGKSRSFVKIWLSHPFNILHEKKTFMEAGAKMEDWFPDKSKLQYAAISFLDFISEIQALYHRQMQIIDEELPRYKSYKAVLQHVRTYLTLRFLYKELRGHCEDSEILLLPEANRLIAGVLRACDISVLYEKTGQRIQHVLIDEFQDTSQLQWDNIRPLMEQTMSSGNFNLIVGDIKQAIYRWRSGKWEIMHQGVERDLKFFEDIYKENLSFNYRSRPEIIRFNNTLFAKAVPILGDCINTLGEGINEWIISLYKIYSNADQKIPENRDNETGYVEIKLLNEPQRAERDQDQQSEGELESQELIDHVLEWISEVLSDLYKDGYSPGDIAILVRKHEEAEQVIKYLDFLGERTGKPEMYSALSEKGYKLSSHPVVRWMITMLKYRLRSQDGATEAALIEVLQLLAGQKNFEWKPIWTDETKKLVDNAVLEPLSNLYSWFVLILEMFDFKNLAPAFSNTFLDLVRNYEKKNGSNPRKFIEWWHANESSQGVHQNQTPDAIQVITIHKSKGLEFPIVLMPFNEARMIDQNLRGESNFLYVTSDDLLLRDLGKLPVTPSKSGLEWSWFYQDFLIEKVLKAIDSINLMYVATTRAVERLYIALQIPDQRLNSIPLNHSITWSELIYKSMCTLHNHPKMWKWGQKTPKDSEILRPINEKPATIELKNSTVKSHFILPSMSIGSVPSLDEGESSLHYKLQYGQWIHDILQRMEKVEDMDNVLSQMVLLGQINTKDYVEIRTKLVRFFELDQAVAWFQPGLKNYREREIIEVNGKAYRPDKVILKSNETIVIDFKTGNFNKRHVHQVRKYASLLTEMGLPPVHAWLAYVDIPEIQMATDEGLS